MVENRRKTLPAGNGKEVARNWHRLVESVQLMLSLGLLCGIADWQTAGHDREWGCDVEVIGAFNIRSILAREDRSGVNCLTL
jgi:hypothetical protein